VVQEEEDTKLYLGIKDQEITNLSNAVWCKNLIDLDI